MTVPGCVVRYKNAWPYWGIASVFLVVVGVTSTSFALTVAGIRFPADWSWFPAAMIFGTAFVAAVPASAFFWLYMTAREMERRGARTRGDIVGSTTTA